MQNLKFIDRRVVTVQNDIGPFAGAAWDLQDDSLICAFGPSLNSTLFTLKRLRQDACQSDDAELVTSWDASPPNPDMPCDRVIDIHNFPDTRTIVVVFEGGDIVIVKEGPDSSDRTVEIVGSVDAGIAAAGWSPDEQLLLLATKADTVLFMTRSFQSIADLSFTAEDLKISNHVSVGWGKAETQFRGRGAKALRDPTIPERIDAGTLSPHDDGRVCISWRGDGQHVAVNSVLTAQPARRVIRVISREGVLESVSEPVDGLEAALSWKPSGQIIAGIQRREERCDVVFFERNGLRHGEFSLRLSAEELQWSPRIDLQWNIDSTVLAVVLSGRVQLWTSSNYHWYLKQDIVAELISDLDPTSGRLVWHPEKPLQACHIASHWLEFTQHSFQYQVGSTSIPHDAGIIAVIDGKQIDISPLAIANVPPPMAFDRAVLQQNIIDVAISNNGTMIAALHRQSVSLLTCDYQKKPPLRASVHSTINLPDPSYLQMPIQVIIQDDQRLVILFSERCLSRYSAWSMDWRQYEENLEETEDPPVLDSGQVVDREAKINDFAILVQDPPLLISDGSITDMNTAHLVPGQLPSCASYRCWPSGQTNIVFGLNSNGILHIRSEQQTLKIPGCTSYITTESYLVFTTNRHLLKFVHLHDQMLDIPLDEPEADERCRLIERGAKIVTAMPSTFAVVLQMPRGNLETIYPRALVLAGIRKHLRNKDYKKAFLVCRSQRVDMNILYDYLPSQLLQDVQSFIKQVQKKEYIDLFLSSLSEEDTSATIYKDTLGAAADHEQIRAIHGSKINLICDAFLAALEKRLPETLQNVITAHVCKSPPDLAAALHLIADLRKSGSEEEVEHAVDHVCFLADVNQLYDHALGLYELEVALLVAQQSQKDPREYLPYLQSLQTTEARRQHFIIDNDLKRYSKAITHLHALDAFEELMVYVKRHSLYNVAINLYRHDAQRLPGLTRAYADFLVSRNRYDDAAVLYECVHDYRAANEAYRSAGLWRESLSTAALVPLSASEIEQLADGIAEAQEEAKDFSSAAVVRLDYLGDLPGAVKLHCRAYNFAEATRLAILKQKPELLSEVIDPSLIECSASMTELLAEMKGQINAQVPRLRELREKKLEEPMAYLNAGEGEDGDVPDNLSVAPTDASTSGGTFMTRYTNRSTGTLATNATRKTSKNRRREERKRAKGKKGTVYEEEYLVNSITRLIERLNTTSDDITRLVQGLIRRTMRERAIAVENAMAEVWELCKQHMHEVYEVGVDKGPADELVTDADHPQIRPVRGQGVLWESMNAMQTKLAAPELKPYARSGSLTS